MSRPQGFFEKKAPFVDTTVVEIPIRSGKIIAGDDLRPTPYFDVEQPSSLNYGIGIDAWTRAYAEKCELGYAFVGNSCPSITRQEDGSLIVVEPELDPADEPVLVNNETVVAFIVTDLWAVMFTDYENWLSHGGPAVEETELDFHGGWTVIDVTPGLYRWTAYSSNDEFDIHRDGRIEYARLELIQAF